MIMNFAMVKDTTVTFTCQPSKPNGLVDNIPFETLFSEYGLIVPQFNGSLALLDYFETGVYSAESLGGGLVAMVVTPSGKVYQYFALNNFGIRRCRIATGKGAFYVRGEEACIEELVHMAHHIYPDPKKVVSSLEDYCRTVPGRYVTLKIEDIQAMLKERNITKEPPAMHFIGMEDKEMGREPRQYGG